LKKSKKFFATEQKKIEKANANASKAAEDAKKQEEELAKKIEESKAIIIEEDKSLPAAKKVSWILFDL